MSTDNDNNDSKDKTALEISAKKFSRVVDFEEDLERENNKKPDEKEEQEKDEDETQKQNVLDHWAKLLVKEPPKRRTCHTSFIHDSYLYVIGGIDITEKKQDDIYKVNLDEPNAVWEKIDPLGEKLGKIAYHAGAEINGFYYIVGGQDETLTTLNSILVFDITQQRIGEKIELEKEKFPPLESHTVNAYNDQSLIIYGGMTGRDYNKHVYSFDIQNKEMKNLTENLEDDKMPPPRQDHAAIIYNGNLYIYGGIGPDSKIYDDMWKFELSSNSWTQIKTEQQINKEKKIEQKKMEKQQSNQNGQENVDEDEDEEFYDDEEEDESKRDIRPEGRSGHSMVLVGDMFYIFGGKTGLIKESNEIWEFNPSDVQYSCVHQTLLEQFTKEELNRISAENKNIKKKFRWLTRSEVEKRTNPSFNDKNKKNDDKKNQNDKNKNKNKNKKDDKNKDKDKKKSDKSKKKKNEKTDNKNQNKDIEGKYADQVLCRPNVVKMRKTLIFTSDPEKIEEGLNTLAQDEKENLNSNITRIKGELPEPRDGQSVCVRENNLYVFGGDRFKFPFNDLFVLDTNQLPRLKFKTSDKKKKEREKEREEDLKNREKREEDEDGDKEGKKEGEEGGEGEEAKEVGEDGKQADGDKTKSDEDKTKKDEDKTKKEEDKTKKEDKNKEDERLLTLIEKITYPKEK